MCKRRCIAKLTLSIYQSGAEAVYFDEVLADSSIVRVDATFFMIVSRVRSKI